MNANPRIEEARPLPDIIYDWLRERILVGELVPGGEIRQELLAREFGTSRVPVREALSRLETDSGFDLVLCDLMMPDVNGAAVYASVKRDHPELAERFVFMTGGAFTTRAREFLSQHPGAQLEKPFNIADIEKLLGQFAASAALRGA